MEIPKELEKDIHLFCKANNIKDINKFIIECVRNGFMIEKYGSAPPVKVKISTPTEEPEQIEKPIV